MQSTTRDCLHSQIPLGTCGTRSTHLMGHQDGTLRDTGSGRTQGYYLRSSRFKSGPERAVVLMYRPFNLPAPSANTLGLRPQNLQNLLSYCCGAAHATACPIGERLVGACFHCATALCFTAVYPGNPAAFTTTHRGVRLVDRKNPDQMDTATLAEVS